MTATRKTTTLNVDLADRSYPIHIGPGLLQRGEMLAQCMPRPKAVVVTNDVVAPLYLDTLIHGLKSQNIPCEAIILPDGEDQKSWESLNKIFDALLTARAERKTTLIALGGGVIGDLTGFAAATYQRGAPYLQVPTTLLAQVDSSVGGKTAINHPLGKNMVGAFYQPRAVIADTDTLKTLPDRELSAGLAEVIKYGLIGDREFFDWLDANLEKLLNRDPVALTYAIEISCRNKAQIVAADETEQGVRALLNFGHTFGHAIEAGLGYGQWLHGEAVAAGMAIAARVSQHMKLLDQAAVEKTISLLQRARLPVKGPALGIQRYIELMGHDKKVDSGEIRYVLLRKIGEAFTGARIPTEILETVLGKEGVHAG